jgi:hypothetical protein
MKRLVIAALVVSLFSALAVVLARDADAQPIERSPFVGDWYAIDPDGTDWMLSIGGFTRVLYLRGSDASTDACPADGPAVTIGIGRIDPADSNLLHVGFLMLCLGHWTSRVAGTATFEYNPSIDQMVMDGSLVWYRR